MKPLTPLELEIMDVIWDLKKATVRQVFEVFREHPKLAYTTVMTVMGMLEQKGRRGEPKRTAYTYEPTRTRRAAISAQVQDFLDRVFDGRPAAGSQPRSIQEAIQKRTRRDCPARRRGGEQAMTLFSTALTCSPGPQTPHCWCADWLCRPYFASGALRFGSDTGAFFFSP